MSDNRVTLQITTPPATTALVRQIMGFLPTIVGLCILLGGGGRFLSKSSAFQRELAPWWVWGLVFALPGLWLLVTAVFFQQLRVFWPACLCSAVMWFWVLCLGRSAIADQHAGLIAFGFCFWAAVALSAVAVKDRDRHA